MDMSTNNSSFMVADQSSFSAHSFEGEDSASNLNDNITETAICETSLMESLNGDDHEFRRHTEQSSPDNTGPPLGDLSISIDMEEQQQLLARRESAALQEISSVLADANDAKAVFGDDISDDSSSIMEIEDISGESTMQNSTAEVTRQDEATDDNMCGNAKESNNKPTSESEANKEHTYFQNSLVELARRSWESNAEVQRYTKGCLWSPDGTCILVPVHKDGMHVMELSIDLFCTDAVSPKRELNELRSAVHVPEGGTVYDVAWYPFMNSGDPGTCCWAATRQHEPIHLWDAFTGEMRCSYRGYDDMDEVETAISIVFANDGQKLLGGYKKSIRIFDTNTPGRDFSTIKLKQAISCFATTTANDSTVTTGTWTGYIQHYDLRSPQLGPLFTLGGHKAGITWLRYAEQPTGDYMLFSGARKDGNILQWDMRNYLQPVHEYQRVVNTHQRIYFDLSPQQQWLASGDTEGMLRIWDLNHKEKELVIPVHNDCCNGVHFHPTLPILATSSGQYHFPSLDDKPEETEDKIVDYENALLFLWMGKTTSEEA